MFTGIIQAIGTLVGRRATTSGVRFDFSAPGFSEELSPGDSVSVSGVCLTVEAVDTGLFVTTSVGETLRRTTLRDLVVGGRVNLERAATPSTALGGHFVQGHVDGVGRVISFARTDQDRLLSVRLPRDVFRLSVPKGSIAIDGVSLTVVEKRSPDIAVIAIVPFTLEHTVIGEYRAGRRVNVEADIIGKYIAEYITST